MPKSITQSELKKMLHYNHNTGLFTWLIKPNRSIRIGDIAGTKNPDGYICIGINKYVYLAHRLAWLYDKGYCSENDIDHRDRIKHHNWISNLREGSRTCNMRNRNKQKNNKSGITGVCWNRQRKRWQADIQVYGKTIYLGLYDNISDATNVRWEAEKKYNFPNCNTTSSSYNYLKEKGLI